MGRYESVVIFQPELDESAVRDQLEKIEGVIKAHGGEVEKQDIWGRRELSYRIKKKGFGIYVCLVFNGDNKLVSDLDRQMKINDQVMRSLIVAKDKHAPDGRRPEDSFDIGASPAVQSFEPRAALPEETMSEQTA